MRFFLLLISVLPLLAITDVGGIIDSNTIWGPTGNPPDSIYNLVDNVSVTDSVVLTIQPGTRLQASHNGFYIYGALIAKGTSTSKVIFTSSQGNQPGDWDGLYLVDADSVILINTNLEYAGVAINYGTYSLQVDSSQITHCNDGIYVFEGAAITNSEISYNVSNGIRSFTNTLRDKISNNYIAYNGTGLRIDGSTMPDFVEPNVFTSNGTDIHICFDLFLDCEAIWQPDISGVECLVEGVIHLNPGASFIISPGNTFKFLGNSISLDGGRLIAIGSAMNKITFTSANNPPNPGDWDGFFTSCPSPDSNILCNCVIEYALTITGMPMRIDSSTIRYCEIGIECYGVVANSEINNNVYGFRFEGEVLHINNNIIRDNNTGIYAVPAGSEHTNLPIFDIPNQFRDNQTDIWLNTGEFRIKEDYCWNPSVDSVNILVYGDIYVDTAFTWHINPGNHFLMNGSAGIFVNGSIQMIGMKENKIIFTSANTSPNPGDWDAIWLRNTSCNNQFRHCVFKYGYGAIIGFAPCMIDSSLIDMCIGGFGAGGGEIRDCNIMNCSYWGISCYGVADSLKIVKNFIMNNAIGIYCEQGTVPTIEYNTISGNTDYGVYNYDNNYWIYAENNWWGDSTGPRDTSSVDTLYNPTGLGDRVSDHVDYQPWLDSPVFVEEHEDNSQINKFATNFFKTIPNPFVGKTAISFDLQKKGCVLLKIYNLAGQLVRSCREDALPIGSHNIFWDGTDDLGQKLPAGIYIIRLERQDLISSWQKIIKIK